MGRKIFAFLWASEVRAGERMELMFKINVKIRKISIIDFRKEKEEIGSVNRNRTGKERERERESSLS